MQRLVWLLLALMLLASGCETPANPVRNTARFSVAIIREPADPLGDEIQQNLTMTKRFSNIRIETASPGIVAEETMRALAEEGISLIVVASPRFKQDLTIVAPDYPETAFVIFHEVVDGDNVTSVGFDFVRGAALAGALGALVMKSRDNDPDPENKLALITIPEGNDPLGQAGFFTQGARSANPAAEVIIKTIDPRNLPKNMDYVIEELITAKAKVVCIGDPALAALALRRTNQPGPVFIGIGMDYSIRWPGAFLASVTPSYESVLGPVARDVQNNVFIGAIMIQSWMESAIDITPLRSLTPAERLYSENVLTDLRIRQEWVRQILAIRRALPESTRNSAWEAVRKTGQTGQGSRK